METPFLTLTQAPLPPGFWTTKELVILQNPRAPQPLPSVLPAAGLLFATSGSTGQPKWLRHTTASLLASAAAVNQFFQITADDVWLRALPLFHVGGMGIEARAQLSGSRVVELAGPWDPAALVHQLGAERVTLCSLVPTQIFDLVATGLRAPSSLRAVIVGGGHLPPSLQAQAKALGWPVLASYGLTEAGSQVATERDGALVLLESWAARCNAQGCLELKGPALASDFWQGTSWQPLTTDGWFTTADLVHLEGRNLTWLGRADATVKILGELVNLDLVQQTLSQLAGHPVCVVAVPAERSGHRLFASPLEANVLASYHATCPPFARVEAAFPAELIASSPLGKPQRPATTAAVSAWLANR